MSGLNQAPGNPLVNIGLGLMSAAKPYGNVGDALMQANSQTLQNRGMMQQQGIQSYQLARQKEIWPAYKAIADQVARRYGGGNMSAGTSMAPPSNAPGVPSQAPQDQNQYRPLPPMSPASNDPVGDLNLSKAAQSVGFPTPIPDPKSMQEAFELSQKQRQVQVAPSATVLKSVASAGNADQLVQNDPELAARYSELAPHMGLNPDPKTLIPENARAFAAMAHNLIQGSVGGSSIDMPKIYDVVPGGPGGQNWVVERGGTGAPKAEGTQALPDYSLEKSWDPVTQQNRVQPVMTKPGAPPPPIAAIQAAQGRKPTAQAPVAAPPGNGLGQPAAPPMNTGYTAPSSDAIKSVGFAASLRSGLTTVRNLERQGIAPSPTQRMQIIKVASGEDSGALSLWMQQQALKHNFDPNMQTYLAGMMPVIQAVSHDQSGARLNESQIKSNLETVIPVDVGNKPALSQINASRDGFYHQSLIGAGASIHTPQFEDTLGADQRHLALPRKNAQGWTLHRDTRNNYAYVSPDGKNFQPVQ